jgi:hypothetical protein
MNPYAAFLAGRDPFELVAATPDRLNALFNDLGAEGLERSLALGKWNARAILCHLADTEIAFAFRLRQALAEPHHVVQPFDQDAWSTPYSALAAIDALETFSTVRRWNVALLATVEPDTLSKPVSHPERGTMTYRTLIETMAGHDQNHLQQLEALAKR